MQPTPFKPIKGLAMRVLLLGWWLSSALAHAAPPTAKSARLDAPERHFVQARWAQSLALSGPLQKSSAELLRAAQAQCAQTGAQTDPAALLKATELTRTAWRQVMTDWVRWSSLETPLLRERLLLRRLDSRFTEVAAMRQAMLAASTTPTASLSPNTPPQAMGLGAMEWLLWSKPAVFNGAPPCPYLAQLAQHWQQELSSAHDDLQRHASMRTDRLTYEELVNQWLFGLHKAIQRHISMRIPPPPEPSPPNAPTIAIPRQPSQSLSIDAAARWDTLKHAAIGPKSLTTLLQAKGHTALAQQWQTQVQSCDALLQQWYDLQAPLGITRPNTPPGCLFELINTMSREVIRTLQVPIGFQDGDGG